MKHYCILSLLLLFISLSGCKGNAKVADGRDDEARSSCGNMEKCPDPLSETQGCDTFAIHLQEGDMIRISAGNTCAMGDIFKEMEKQPCGNEILSRSASPCDSILGRDELHCWLQAICAGYGKWHDGLPDGLRDSVPSQVFFGIYPGVSSYECLVMVLDEMYPLGVEYRILDEAALDKEVPLHKANTKIDEKNLISICCTPDSIYIKVDEDSFPVSLDSIDGGMSQFQRRVEELRRVYPSRKLAIRATSDVPYSTFKQLISELQDMGESRYLLITEQKDI